MEEEIKNIEWLIDWFKSWEFRGNDGNLFKLGDLTDEQLKRACESDNMAYRLGAERLIHYKKLLKEQSD